MKLTFPLLLAATSAAMGAYADEPPSILYDEVYLTESTSLDESDAEVSAEADSTEVPQQEAGFPPFQDGHFYMGARAGWAVYQDACGSDARDCNDGVMGYGLYAGYQFNNWFALEGGYTSYGEPDATYDSGKVTSEMSGWDVAAKLRYPITERLDMYTRIGGSYLSVDKSFSAMPNDISVDEWNVLSSFGMSYRLSQRWSMRGEYQFIDGIGSGESEQADSHFASLGLTYHFGQKAPVVVEEPAPVVVEEPAPVRYVTVDKPLSLSAESLFGFDSSEIKSTGSLDLLVQQLQDFPDDTIRIIGYTDASGSEEYNQRLSKRRAQSTADYLVEQGIDASRLTVIGMGENSPIASNDTEEGRAQNRRVEVLFDTTIQEQQEVTDTPATDDSLMEE
ncbi:OmpA family protein [Vibrio parahaemolyticus]|nr:OmpA family protein [Vibrio parahaemolyticus]MCR9655265.1 OmpA family protein [Vibrio parahaemolyticus]